ncbi:MAG: hypothetical protein V3V66_05175 [Anaerolineales bacterium]
MKAEHEIITLKEQLERLTGFIADNGTDKEFENESVKYSNDVCDALYWVLGEITTEDFQSGAYLDIPNLEVIAKNIEERSGKKKADYE